MTEKEIKKFIPGFTMGFVRSIISHPFEMLKLKTQMNINDNLFNKTSKNDCCKLMIIYLKIFLRVYIYLF